MKVDLKKNRFVCGSFRCDRCDGVGYIQRNLRPGQTSIPDEVTLYNSKACPECSGARVVYLYEEDSDYSEDQKQNQSFLLNEITLLQKRIKKLNEDKRKLISFIDGKRKQTT